MTKKITVKPGAGFKRVYRPDNPNAFITGETVVERTSAIIRLLKSGDLVEVNNTKKKTAKKAASKKPEAKK